jgi:hypothetical protein
MKRLVESSTFASAHGLHQPRGYSRFIGRPGGRPRNHIGQPFDIDTFERITERITTKTMSLPFDVR